MTTYQSIDIKSEPVDEQIMRVSGYSILPEEGEEPEEREVTDAKRDTKVSEDFNVELIYYHPPDKTEDITASYVHTPNDTNDPSYSNLTLPYSVICRQRYRKARAMQKAQFITEIKAHELLRDKAIDGVRIHREFCNAVVSQVSPEELITLTKKQKERLNKLLEEP